MISEKKRMEACTNGKEVFGHISLNYLAIPGTVRVKMLGKNIIPVSFDVFGHPKFTGEQQSLYAFKESEIERRIERVEPLLLDVTYIKREFNVPRRVFDTLDGIREMLGNLDTLNQMLDYRRMYYKANEGKEPLNEFMLFGCFWLDQSGQIMPIEKTLKDKLISTGDVETMETFRGNNRYCNFTSDGYAIPPSGTICNCCGRELNIKELKNNPCVCINGRYYHDSCYREYRRELEVDKFTRRLMDLIYKTRDYTFELLPNGYCDGYCCTHIPWFMFHTIDGDIKIGWRKRVISIEWQENYKPFDMNIFVNEDVTKWDENGKRGIHAWSNDKAYEYLKKVVEILHPKYSIYGY